MPFGAQSRLPGLGWVGGSVHEGMGGKQGKRTELELPTVVCRHFDLHNYIV